jgi:chromosome segregation ATPase
MSNEEILRQIYIKSLTHIEGWENIQLTNSSMFVKSEALKAMDEAVNQHKEEIERLKMTIDELRSQNIKLYETIDKTTNRCIKVFDEILELRTHLNLKEGESIIDRVKEMETKYKQNKDLLVDVCEYFSSAEDAEMDKYDLENYIEQIGYKLGLAINNYK